MTSFYAGARPVLLAEHARNAVKPGSCPGCRWGLRIGQRVAQLATGEWVHAWCAASVVQARQNAQRKRSTEATRTEAA